MIMIMLVFSAIMIVDRSDSQQKENKPFFSTDFILCFFIGLFIIVTAAPVSMLHLGLPMNAFDDIVNYIGPLNFWGTMIISWFGVSCALSDRLIATSEDDQK